jgi:O-glycosyl hydrolase
MAKLSDLSHRGLLLTLILATALCAPHARAATISIDDSPAGQLQAIDGFGTCHGSAFAAQPWYRQLYFDDMACSIMRMDLTPHFTSPYSDFAYCSPWFGNQPPLKIDDRARPGGPEHNYCRTYTGAADYSRDFAGKHAPIAVMGPSIEKNIALFAYNDVAPEGELAQAGMKRKERLGDFKLYGSIWSPAPWVKIADGNTWAGGQFPMPPKGTNYPFIWGGNFSGGQVDVSDTPLDVFNDGIGPTSALTQFARCTAAYIKGFQDHFGVRFYAISIQNELNFPEFYNSCTYRTSAQYITALKRIRAELDKYADLKAIQIIGPEDLLGGDGWSMWQLGGGASVTDKNLHYLQDIAADPAAEQAISFFCIHGYAGDGATAVGADSRQWSWWVHGWNRPPARGLPSGVKGFADYGKKSWMTETSGEKSVWLEPSDLGQFPGNGAWSIAFKTQQALTAGRESAILYWQFAEKDDQTTAECLTRRNDAAKEPKYVAAKHFFKFIRPGAVALRTTNDGDDGITASAFGHARNHTLTIVLVNRSSQTQSTTIQLPAAFAAAPPFDSFTSSASALWQPAPVKPEAGKLTIDVPGFGVVTLNGKQTGSGL